MVDFDPTDLGPYIPPSMVPIREAAKAILAGRIHGYLAYNDILMQDERLSVEEVDELQASSHDVRRLHEARQFQEWSWSQLRHHLVIGDYIAFAIDAERIMHPLDRSFWISEYGNSALSFGKVEIIPLFKPNGDVMIHADDVEKMFQAYKADTFQNLEPPFHKLPSLLGDTALESEGVPSEIMRRKGARRIYDVELFLLEAFSIIYESNPMPKTQEELGRLTADAYEARDGEGGRPSRPWIRSKIAKLWHHLHIEDK